jgi:hypothetical protein
MMWVCLGWGRQTAVYWRCRETTGKWDLSLSFSKTCCLSPATTGRAKNDAIIISAISDERGIASCLGEWDGVRK